MNIKINKRLNETKEYDLTNEERLALLQKLSRETKKDNSNENKDH